MIERIPLPKVLLITNDSSTYSHSTLLECLTNFLAFGQGVEQIHVDEQDSFDGTRQITHLCDAMIARSMALEQVNNDVENNVEKFVILYIVINLL